MNTDNIKLLYEIADTLENDGRNGFAEDLRDMALELGQFSSTGSAAAPADKKRHSVAELTDLLMELSSQENCKITLDYSDATRMIVNPPIPTKGNGDTDKGEQS